MIKGFLVIDKPKGMTSADVVYKVKKRLPRGTKIGHAGTLDPNVTGVLPLAIGSATKAFAFLEDTIKTYRVGFKLGIATDTEDVWGELLEECPYEMPSLEEIERVMQRFIGEYLQTPPMYSAKKQGGVKLYQMARKGQTVYRQPELRHIFGLQNIQIEQDGTIAFTVQCSRGTYIRTLCVDMAKALGTIGAMVSLTRIQTGCFTLDHTIKLEALEALEAFEALEGVIVETYDQLDQFLLPVKTMFESWPKIFVDETHAVHLRNGVKVNLQRFTKERFASGVRIAVWSVEENKQLLGVATASDDGIWFTQWLGE